VLELPENPAQLAALNRSLQTAADSLMSVEQRLGAIRLLALGSPGVVTNRLLVLLDSREPTQIQQAALAGLRAVRDSAMGGGLVSRWRSISPVVRPALLGVLLERRAFHDSLLAALEGGYLQIGELNLDLEQRRRLLRGGTKDIQLRAAKFMGDEEYSNRKSLVREWLEKLPATGSAPRGRLVFEEACAKCHASGTVGYRVGPDLTGVAHRSVEDLLSNILDPNMAINPGFVTVMVETRDGEAQTGLLEVESAAAITLLQAESKRTVISRGDITRLESSGQSLMPEGLEAGRTPQQLRDLIAFLQQPR